MRSGLPSLMLLLVLLSSAGGLSAAEWDAVRRIPPDERVRVISRDGQRVAGRLVSTTAEAVILRDNSGERAMERGAIREVRVEDPGRRVRKGLMWTAIGVGAGIGVGFAVCPGCANEGSPAKFIGPGAAAGAGLGALGFLSRPYRTVYRAAP